MTDINTGSAELRVTGVLSGPPVINDAETVLRFSIRKDSARTRRNPTYLNVKVFGDQVKTTKATLAKATPWDTTITVSGEYVEERYEVDGSKRRAVFCYAESVSIRRDAKQGAA